MNGGGWINGATRRLERRRLGDITGQGYNVVSVGVPLGQRDRQREPRRGTALLLNGARRRDRGPTRAAWSGAALAHAELGEPVAGRVRGRRGRGLLTQITANVITTAGDASLSVADPSARTRPATWSTARSRSRSRCG